MYRSGILVVTVAILANTAGAFITSTPTLAHGVKKAHTSPLGLRMASQPDSSDMMEAARRMAAGVALSGLLFLPSMVPEPAVAANSQEQFKVLQGAASTQDSGSRRTITRGTVLDGSDFSNQNLKGVSFQQSLCRQCNFENTKLKGASFFDGDLSGANMEGADVSNVNFEMSCMKDANLKNAVVNNAYIVATTKLDGINIEGADFTDTFLRKDQQRYLCKRAAGTNPKTGIDTKDSLMCSQVKN